MDVILAYSLYLFLSLCLTIWVAQTLYRSGRPFLIEAFDQNESMADSVNHILLVGFYLINVGFVALFLKFGKPPKSGQEAFEYLSTKIGVVLLVLGAMHFFNLVKFSSMRESARRRRLAESIRPVQSG